MTCPEKIGSPRSIFPATRSLTIVPLPSFSVDILNSHNSWTTLQSLNVGAEDSVPTWSTRLIHSRKHPTRTDRAGSAIFPSFDSNPVCGRSLKYSRSGKIQAHRQTQHFGSHSRIRTGQTHHVNRTGRQGSPRSTAGRVCSTGSTCPYSSDGGRRSTCSRWRIHEWSSFRVTIRVWNCVSWRIRTYFAVDYSDWGSLRRWHANDGGVVKHPCGLRCSRA